MVPAELKIPPRNLIHALWYTKLVKGKGYIFRFQIKKADKLVRLITATQESVPNVRDDILQ